MTHTSEKSAHTWKSLHFCLDCSSGTQHFLVSCLSGTAETRHITMSKGYGHFLNSHPDFFLEICGSVSDEHGERLHQNITAMEGRYKGKWSTSMITDYCWTLMRDSPNFTFNQQAKKAWLQQSYTQPSTYDVVQVRDHSSKTVANEAFVLWFSCSAPQFT